MPRHREQPRPKWVVPAVLTLTAAVAGAGIYFWNEMESDEHAAAGFRSEDDDDERVRSRRAAGRDLPVTGPGSASAAAAIAGAAGATMAGASAVGSRNMRKGDIEEGGGIVGRFNKALKNLWEGGSDSETGGGRGGARGGAGVAGGSSSREVSTRGIPRSVDERSSGWKAKSGVNPQLIDWEKKRIVALVISSLEEVEESLLLSLPTPLDLSRCVLLLCVYSPIPSAPPSLVNLSPRPIPITPSKSRDRDGLSVSPSTSVISYASSVKSFARTQGSPPIISADSSPSSHTALRTPATSGRTSRTGEEIPDDDLLSTPTPANRKKADRRPGAQYYTTDTDDDESKHARNVKPGAGFRRANKRYKNSDSEDDDEEDSNSHSDMSVSLPSLITKTFGPGFPQQQILQFSAPTGVVHMLRHIGVSIAFISESCASVPQANDLLSPSTEATPTPASIQASRLNPNSTSNTTSPPAGGVLPSGGGEIIGMLRDWVGEVVLILDEDEDDSGPTAPSAVSGGEDETFSESRRKKGKSKGKGGVSVETGRKRRWLDKEKGVGRGITIVDRSRLGSTWRAKVEGR